MIIFVFGSNRAGIHGAGAALTARLHYGAIPGEGEGLYGNSYAIPTKGYTLSALPLSEIKKHINTFKEHAALRLQDCGLMHLYLVTCIGCGLTGYKHEEIAPLFKDAPENCFFDKRWAPYL